MKVTKDQKEVIAKCQQSVSWFLRNFGKLKHPSAGIIDFYPFSYQKFAIKQFRTHRFNIFKKCRQVGISKISGAFACWFAMFHSHKTVLIVSRTNDDAMSFLRENIFFIYKNLPEWMRELWKPVKQNEHEIIFPNGSRIKSLTSHPDVLRSNASSLNIIDESAFIQGMDAMWAGGWSTLQHGGNVICISTTNGLGGWYWSTWTDAVAGVNGWNPININWWDMDWEIEYKDPLSGLKRRIAPLDGLRKCETAEEIEKYGPYWSYWLEDQYRALQEQGEAWKFRQEILADFVGSGNTVVPASVLNMIGSTTKDPTKIITGFQTYVHPVTGEVDELNFDFKEKEQGFWVWKEPVTGSPEKRKNDTILEAASKPHSYVMGVDIATGKGKDYSAIEVFDVDTMEQVAEFMARCLPRELLKFIDRIGRWYNCALAIVERNNGGDIVIDSLRMDYMYPRLWRRLTVNDKPKSMSSSGTARSLQAKPYGFSTSSASKPTLNKLLLDYLSEHENEGYQIYSRRLHKQLQTYVRKRDRLGRDTTKTEAEEGAGNFDDLVIAAALALLGVSDASNVQTGIISPFLSASYGESPVTKSIVDLNNNNIFAPISVSPEKLEAESIQEQLDQYMLQLGAVPISEQQAIISHRSYFNK